MARKSLSQDVIKEILLRLPAKSIVRFRSTCRLFNYLSTETNFISAHTQRCRTSMKNSMAIYVQIMPQICISLQDITGRTSSMPLTAMGEIQVPMTLKQTCDGFICFTRKSSNYMFLVNPLTNEKKSIKFCNSKISQVIAFYYHETSRKYRMIVTTVCDNLPYVDMLALDSEAAMPLNFVKHYSMLYFPIGCEGGNVMMDGNLYCFGIRRNEFNRSSLVVFDLETDQYRVSYLSLPDSFSYRGVWSRMFEVEGKLCVYNIMDENDSIRYRNLRIEMWVLVNEERGIWIQKHLVYTEMLRDLEKNYSVITCYPPYIIFVESYSDGIELPYMHFTFYFAQIDAFNSKIQSSLQTYWPLGYHAICSFSSYNATLASMDMLTNKSSGMPQRH